MILLETTKGNITIELDKAHAPNTAANFLKLVQDKFYDGTIFHRVIKNFMIQGGGMTPDMKTKPQAESIKNEAKTAQSNQRGTVAMARTSDPHSACNQFFINVVDNTFLDFKDESVNGWGYCVFGQVVDGMDVVDAIKQVDTTSRAGHQDVPVDQIEIVHAKVIDSH